MTTNEMIYKTISTKVAKEPIYKSVLEDLGYEVYDSGWSEYDNWTVGSKSTNKSVVLSKGYDNKKGLFDKQDRIPTKNIKKVNFADYLNKNRSAEWRDAGKKRSRYYRLRTIIKSSKSNIWWYEDLYTHKKEQIEELTKDLERYHNAITSYQKKLDAARKKVAELKTRQEGAKYDNKRRDD